MVSESFKPSIPRHSSVKSSANALVVDGEGRGHVMEVIVELSPGGSGAC